MKTIVYNEECLTATGQPIYLPDSDVKRVQAARKIALAEELQAAAEHRQPRPTQLPVVETTFAGLMMWFVDNLPYARDNEGKPTRKLSIADAGNAYAVIQAFRDRKNGTVVLEDAVYDWLIDTVDTDAPEAFRTASMAAIIKTRLQHLVTANG